jgi:mono/diheme cytochrome c family protein
LGLHSPKIKFRRHELALSRAKPNRRAIFTSLRFSGAATLMVLAGVANIQAQKPASAQPGSAMVEGAAFLKQYCVTCHNQKLKTAGLLLDTIDLRDVSRNGELLEKIVLKVRSGAMPPASARRPDKPAANALLALLETSLDRASAAHPNPGRPMMLHRMNRTEYLNSVRDLLEVQLNPDDSSLLPPDDKSHGFDNNGDVLGLSPLLLERYLSIARRVTTAALGPATLAPNVYTRRVSYELPQTKWIDGLPFGTRGGTAFSYRFPTDGEYTIRLKLQRRYDRIIGIDRYVGGSDTDDKPRRERIVVGLDGKPVALFAIGMDQTIRESLDVPSDGFLPMNGTPADEPVKILTKEEQAQRGGNADMALEVRLQVKAGERQISAAFLARFIPVPGQVREQFVSGTGGPPRPMGIDSVIVSGPFAIIKAGGGPGEASSRRRIFSCRPAREAEELPCAKTILGAFAHRAYRRPVSDGELQDLIAAYKEGRNDGDFEAGIGMGLRRMLMDPAFLFRVERDPAGIAPDTAYRITDLELASRVSFFLWSSIPDEQLLAAAESGQLRDSVILQAQVRRMLADPRANSLVTNFAAEWLSLRIVEGVKPDPIIFPEFDDGLRLAFERETELLLDDVLLGDRSVLELLNANYTFVNERLSRHYNIPNVYGDQFRRVTVTDGIRGGLLGQGSILTATSYPNRTSPVVRGKWILETLLGSPPPPPPPDVPALPEAEATGKVLTMRERLSEHRKNVACASCHARMDPLGFALENFDGTGKWRIVESTGPADKSRNPIDASGQLADGTKFEGATGLRQVLLEHSGEFVYRMTERLLTYALGRGSDWYDAPAIRAAVSEAEKNDYRFSALLMGIVQSTPFQMRLSQSMDSQARHSSAMNKPGKEN